MPYDRYDRRSRSRSPPRRDYGDRYDRRDDRRDDRGGYGGRRENSYGKPTAEINYETKY